MKKFFQGLKLKRSESTRVSEDSKEEDDDDYEEQEAYEEFNELPNDDYEDDVYEGSSDDFSSDYEEPPEADEDTYLNRDEITFSEQATRNQKKLQKQEVCDSDGAAVSSVDSYELLDEQPTNQCQRLECTENSEDEVLQMNSGAKAPPIPMESPKNTIKSRKLPRTPSSGSNSSSILSRPLPRIPKMSESENDLYESNEDVDEEPDTQKTKPAFSNKEDTSVKNIPKKCLPKPPAQLRPTTSSKPTMKPVPTKPKPKFPLEANNSKVAENAVKPMAPTLPFKPKKKTPLQVKPPENEGGSDSEAQISCTEKKSPEDLKTPIENKATNKNKIIAHKNLVNRMNKIEESTKKIHNQISNCAKEVDQQKREIVGKKLKKLPVPPSNASHHLNSPKSLMPKTKPLMNIYISPETQNASKPSDHDRNVGSGLKNSVSTSERNINETKHKKDVKNVIEKIKKIQNKGEYDDNEVSAKKNSSVNIPKKSEKNTLDYLEAPWFFGDISRDEASARLKKYGKQGAFLIRTRQENSAEIPFSLSIYNGARVMHLQIRLKKDGQLAIGFEKPDEMMFANLQEMVTFYSQNQLAINGKSHDFILFSSSPQK